MTCWITLRVSNLYSEILSPEYSEKMAQAFQGEQVDDQDVIEAFKEHSFDYYKSTKVGDGSWKKLIGINTIDNSGSVAVVETGAQFANTPMKNVNPAIVRTKSGTRENYVEFRPIQG
jgi:ketopantoate reductase